MLIVLFGFFLISFLFGQEATTLIMLDSCIKLLKGKRVGIVASNASVINGINIVDTLLNAGVRVKKIFAPEHGFRQQLPAGKKFSNFIDVKTNLPVISLYGQKKTPSKKDLQDIDVIVFDLQDVGLRCYTFISTLFYVLKSACKYNREVIVIDRPNPNGFFIDGPPLDSSHISFVGLIPVPLVYGMTIGELALMIIKENFISNCKAMNLKVIPLTFYDRCKPFPLKESPSPGLPDSIAVWMYPHLVLFEGTIASLNRGSPQSFKSININNNTEFFNLDSLKKIWLKKEIYIDILLRNYQSYPKKDSFFTSYFDKIAGTSLLRKQIITNTPVDSIRNSWKPYIDNFKKIRKKYLLYPDCPYLEN